MVPGLPEQVAELKALRHVFAAKALGSRSKECRTFLRNENGSFLGLAGKRATERSEEMIAPDMTATAISDSIPAVLLPGVLDPQEELDKIRSNEKYVKLIAEYGDKDSIIENESLEEINVLDESRGAEIEGHDLEVLQGFANSVRSLQDTKKSLADYVDQKMNEIAPNLSNLLGSSLGAKLIAHIGGVEKLSLLPSSTIQIMGAEKALFRHKKTGERPPKHGLIYQHPEIRGARWWLKGKIARALAAKIALAVRKDVYSGEFDPDLKEEFEKKVEEIKKEHPFPPRTKKSKEGKRDKGKKKKKREKYRKNIKDYY